MVIANGFITDNEEQAFEEASKRIKGKELRRAVMPPLCAMTYFISDIGEMFGCRQMKNFCITKPLKIEQRYSHGCNMRYSVGDSKQKNAFMQYIMYSTFVTGVWNEDLKLEPKDGNANNYQLENIRPKQEDHSTLCRNIELLQSVYRSHFLEVAWYIRYVSMEIAFEDAKDIAANSFYELCNMPYDYRPDYFVGLWKNLCRKRAYDFLNFRTRFSDMLYEDGEERFGHTDHAVEVANILECNRGEKRKQYLRLWSEGETYSEIAKLTGAGPSTVSSEVCRAIKELKVFYQKDIAIWKRNERNQPSDAPTYTKTVKNA